MLPNFIICGAQKGGTTALYHYLKQHPEIYLPKKKEVHYFDLNYDRDIKWYEKHFKGCRNRKVKAIGEASPLYVYLEEVPERIYKLFPDIKLIFILRNPVDRAYSHYWHEVKLGYETLCFEKAIEKEEMRLSRGDIFSKQHYSYKDRGKYAEQLKRFSKFFPKEQMLILISEELRENPEKVLRRIFNFLEVDTNFTSPSWHIQHYKGKQPRVWKLQRIKAKLPNNILGKYMRDFIDFINLKDGYPPINIDTQKKLLGYFKPYNEELKILLGKKIEEWCK